MKFCFYICSTKAKHDMKNNRNIYLKILPPGKDYPGRFGHACSLDISFVPEALSF